MKKYYKNYTYKKRINFGHSATQPRRHVAFLDKPDYEQQIQVAVLNDEPTMDQSNPAWGYEFL